MIRWITLRVLRPGVRGCALAAAVLGLAGTGCASRGPALGDAVTAAPTFPPSFARAVGGITVRGADGAPYDHPFTGGFNVPRPQLVDVDRDGDLDLFVQEVSGQLTFFEHVGAGRFEWRTDRFQNLQIGEWYRFADIDGDGDFDLLTEEPFSLMRYYRNDGQPGSPAFTLAADTLRDVSGAPLFSDRQNIPNVTDIDCDDRLDLFIGRLIGTVSRYEAVSADDNGVPRFAEISERFEDIEIVAQIGSRHGANTLTFADIDRDGDQDLFWGDFFEPGLLFIENTGTCETPVLRGEPVPFPIGDPLATSGYNAPTFGDVDGDGDIDLLVGVIGGAFNPNRTAADNLHYFEQVTPGAFVRRSTRFVGTVDVGSESIPAFADLDGDGDLDLMLSNKIDADDSRSGRMYQFKNEGTAERPVFRLAEPLELPPAYHYAPAFADLDADGDLDLLLGTWKKDLEFYRNEGSATAPRFVLADSQFVSLTRGSNATPALTDVDEDGDLDLFVGEASGTLNFYRNIGSASEPAFELVSDRYLDLDVGRRSFPTPVDLDRDGDIDLVIGRESGTPVFLRNTGTPAAPHFEPADWTAPPLDGFSTPAFVDLDADGDLDLFAGGGGGGLLYYQNRRVRR